MRAYATAAVRTKREAARAGALGVDCLELELVFGRLRGQNGDWFTIVLAVVVYFILGDCIEPREPSKLP